MNAVHFMNPPKRRQPEGPQIAEIIGVCYLSWLWEALSLKYTTAFQFAALACLLTLAPLRAEEPQATTPAEDTAQTAETAQTAPAQPSAVPQAFPNDMPDIRSLPRDLMEPEMLYTAELGINALSVFALETDRRTPNRIGIQVGGGVDYFFSRFVGIGGGLAYANRGFEPAASLSSTASFLDIPVGVVFRTPSVFGGIDGTSISTFMLGGYASIPLGDFKLSGLVTNPTKTSFGIHFSGKTLFPISNQWAIGFTTWGKIGLSECFNVGTYPQSGTLLEVGLGLVVSYF